MQQQLLLPWLLLLPTSLASAALIQVGRTLESWQLQHIAHNAVREETPPVREQQQRAQRVLRFNTHCCHSNARNKGLRLDKSVDSIVQD